MRKNTNNEMAINERADARQLTLSVPEVSQVGNEDTVIESKAMAKKKAVRGEFNMSAEIRELLEGNPDLTGREVVEALQQKHPDQTINRNSANVAFSNARRKLGIRPRGSKAVRRRKPTTTRSVMKNEAVDLRNLKAARKFVSEIGNPQEAIAAIQQLEALQID